MQKSVVKDTKEEDHSSVNLSKAQEKLQEEDRFDQKEQRKKVKAYGELTLKKGMPEEMPARGKQRPQMEECLFVLEW